MTPPTPSPVPWKQRLYWIWLLIAFLAGVGVGRWGVPVQRSVIDGPPGRCVRTDGTVAADTVSETRCKSVCPTCTWEQI